MVAQTYAPAMKLIRSRTFSGNFWPDSLFQLKDEPEGSEGLAKRGVSFRFAIQAMLARVSDGLPTERADPPLARIGKGPIRHARGLKPDGKLAFKH